MNGIYGICEPGVRLRASDIERMASAMGFCGRAVDAPVSEHGARLGASGDSKCALGSGCIVAIDADLSNHGELLRNHDHSCAHGTHDVAELVAGLYRRYGTDCVRKLEGAFALAIWDSSSQQLLLAIDRYGFKSLYWSTEGNSLAFATRLAAIEAVRTRTEVDPAAVMQFLVHTVVPAPLTIYKGMERIEPGTQIVFQGGQVKRRRYWDLDYQESRSSSVQEWRDEVRETIRQAVHTHLDGSDPARSGAFLSGGTDSSSVVAFASELHAPFNTFSINFENPRYDEISFARTAAEHFRTSHHERCVQSADAAEAIPRIITYYEEPFANSSAIGSYQCARLARENGVDVLLAGDGGDELFAGNERYATDRKFALYHLTPRFLRDRVIKTVVNHLPKDGVLSLPGRYIRRADVANPGRMFSYNFFLAEEGRCQLAPEFLALAKPEAALGIAQAHYDSAPHASSELNRLLYLDVKMTLADNDLRKVTGTAELAGVRVRFPLLDRRLVELSCRIPSQLKLKGFNKRYIFKEALKGILPNQILYKKKHGFGVPVGYWIMNDPNLKPLAAVLDEPQTRQRGYFRPEFLSRIKELNRIHPAYYGEILWSVLVLELWHRRSRNYPVEETKTERVGAARAS